MKDGCPTGVPTPFKVTIESISDQFIIDQLQSSPGIYDSRCLEDIEARLWEIEFSTNTVRKDFIQSAEHHDWSQMSRFKRAEDTNVVHDTEHL